MHPSQITALFGTEDRVFFIGVAGWRRIKEKTGRDPPVITQALARSVLGKPEAMSALQWVAAGGLGSWGPDDVREVILQGLIGGGMLAEPATQLVRELVDGRPMMDQVPLAAEIAIASMLGAPEPPGEPQGAAKKTPPRKTRSGAGRTSTPTPRS